MVNVNAMCDRVIVKRRSESCMRLLLLDLDFHLVSEVYLSLELGLGTISTLLDSCILPNSSSPTRPRDSPLSSIHSDF